jgi:putative hydrolase of the HAD superfamily
VTISTVLLDLDGVIRHFDPDHRPGVERTYGLTPGTLQETAFEAELIHSVTTGKISRAAWTAEIGRRVGSPAAASEWLAARGTVDHDLLAVVDQLRAGGLTVAILTNGTDTVPAELDRFGITERFDAVFNTAEIGYIKPDRRAFLHVVTALGVAPEEVFFTDDSAGKLSGAIELGMTAKQYIDLDTFRSHLSELDLIAAPDS